MLAGCDSVATLISQWRVGVFLVKRLRIWVESVAERRLVIASGFNMKIWCDESWNTVTYALHVMNFHNSVQ